MATSLSVGPEFGYALAFGLAALACFVSVRRAQGVDDTETRYGLVGLLVGSGTWAASHVGLLLAPTRELKVASYTVGLVLGFSTVFAWLYFASAYTGRTYHRQPRYRRAGAGLYLSVVAVKLTNPLHHLYFTTEFVTTPFPHLAIDQQWFHWVVTGLAYALAAIGLFMLFETFDQADYDTTELAGLAGLTGLPVVLDIVGFTSDQLIGIIYAPLGVAVFALGVLFVFEERFLAVQLTGDIDDPVVFLDGDDRIADFNRPAERLFPEIADALGDPVESLTGMDEALKDEQGILEVMIDGDRQYFLVSRSSFDLGQTDLGTVLLFSEVTRLERQRRELQRHNDQLESFATGIRHELRNALQIVGGHVEAAGDALESGNVNTARNSMETAASTADRMERTVDDLSTLAQHGQTVTNMQDNDFRTVVERSWETVDTGDLSLVVAGDGQVEANPGRLEELFENAYTFAVHNDASTVEIALREAGFTITDDGTRPPDEKLETVFDHGAAVPNAQAGMAMPNVETLAKVHGWTVTVDREYEDGVRVRISGAAVDTAQRAEGDD